MSETIKLGQEVQCVVTGFKGIAITRCELLHQVTSFDVKPRVGEDGKIQEATSIDAPRLKITNTEQVMEPIPCNDLGFRIGGQAKDPNSGFKGLVQGMAYHITGCVQVLIAPSGLDKHDKPIQSRWFAAGQLEKLSEMKEHKTSNVGGPRPEASNSMSR